MHLYGLDLRDVIGIEAFVSFIAKKYKKVDIVINNACQTVRRPVGYYRPIVEDEMRLWNLYNHQMNKNDNGNQNQIKDTNDSKDGKVFLLGCAKFENYRRNRSGQSQPQIEESPNPPNTREYQKETKNHPNSNTSIIPIPNPTASTTASITASAIGSPNYERTGLCHSALMSQTILLPDDYDPLSSTITTVKDVNSQALDIRRTNSWILKLEQISTPEILETMIINAVAPFILNSRLIPLMMIPTHPDGSLMKENGNRSGKTVRDKFIINVSAMEGKFYRYKMPNHPHTNMAKAALNMMTRTSSEELAKKYHIYMNSVDTGWINDENPLERASKTAKTNYFQTPIDEIDAVARILDPVFSAIGSSDKRVYGIFLKDYRESEW